MCVLVCKFFVCASSPPFVLYTYKKGVNSIALHTIFSAIRQYKFFIKWDKKKYFRVTSRHFLFLFRQRLNWYYWRGNFTDIFSTFFSRVGNKNFLFNSKIDRKVTQFSLFWIAAVCVQTFACIRRLKVPVTFFLFFTITIFFL